MATSFRSASTNCYIEISGARSVAVGDDEDEGDDDDEDLRDDLADEESEDEDDEEPARASKT